MGEEREAYNKISKRGKNKQKNHNRPLYCGLDSADWRLQMPAGPFGRCSDEGPDPPPEEPLKKMDKWTVIQ